MNKLVDTFEDGDAGVAEFDGEECIRGGFVDSPATGDASNPNDLFLVNFRQMNGGNNPNDIFDTSVSVDDDRVVLLDVDQARCADELHF